MVKPESLEQWLSYLERLHPSEIELGLQRVSEVYQRLCGSAKPSYKVITVAGTNGKGSSVALLEAIYCNAGYRVGAYSSPHLVRYNERVRVDGCEVDDTALCHAFERVEQARADTSLTYFEFGTLAALDIFNQASLNVVILEVGMGGRLDAVNIVDADVALITPIDLDHRAWLGNTREQIGAEKAGIMRADHPVVCTDLSVPQSVRAKASELRAPYWGLMEQFAYRQQDKVWHWSSDLVRYRDLPLPRLHGEHQLQNAAGVLMCVNLLQTERPVQEQAIRQGLMEVSLPGRLQRIAGPVEQWLDVAHNPHGARALAAALNAIPASGRTLAVMGLLDDKDVEGVLAPLASQVDAWYVATLATIRSVQAVELAEKMQQCGIMTPVMPFDSLLDAHEQAMCDARMGDRIVVFGSFYAVGALLSTL